MRFLAMISAAACVAGANPVFAQEAAGAPPIAAQTDKSAALTIDTPLEQVAANPAGKAILDKNLPGLTTHPMWESFKAMSLTDLAPMSNGKVTPERLAMVKSDLAALKR